MDIVHSDVNLVGWKSLFTAFACANAQRWFSRNGRSGRSHMETGFGMLGVLLFLLVFGLDIQRETCHVNLEWIPPELVTRQCKYFCWKWFWRWSDSQIEGSRVDVLLLCLTRNFWSRHVILFTKFLRRNEPKRGGRTEIIQFDKYSHLWNLVRCCGIGVLGAGQDF